MTMGVNDPLEFLAREGTDWAIELEVIRQARQIESEAKRDEIKALGLSIGSSVAHQIGQMFR
jgi:hypothetical protein